jgi:hypothetical protein
MKILERLAEELPGIELFGNGEHKGIRATIRQANGENKTTVSELYAFRNSQGQRKLCFIVDSDPNHVRVYTERIMPTDLGKIILSQLNTTPTPTLHQSYYGINVEVDSFSHVRELIYSFFGKQMPKRKPDPEQDAITAQSL